MQLLDVYILSSSSMPGFLWIANVPYIVFKISKLIKLISQASLGGDQNWDQALFQVPVL